MSDKHRISRVITRSGDGGETGLADGSRVSKDDARIEAIGTLDELSACLGVLASLDSNQQQLITMLQNRLFDLGAELAVPGSVRLSAEHVTQLEEHANDCNATLPPLKEFILAGGTQAGAWCHYCRTVARRAERQLVTLDLQHKQNPYSLQWLNRLSDLLFILARTINRNSGEAENVWQP